MPDDAPASGAGGEKLGKWLALGASIIGIFVTLNTFLSGCAQQRVTQASSYRELVAKEETYWSGLYTKYLEVTAADAPDSEARRHKLIALAFLAGRDPPDFEEFETWFGSGPDTAKSTARFARLQRVLIDALMNPKSSSPETAGEIEGLLAARSEVRQRDQDTTGQSTPPAITPVEQAVTSAALAAQSAIPAGGEKADLLYGSRILTAGAPDGWDVDVFWCSGPASSPGGWDADPALKVAQKLSDQAAAGTPIGKGVKLGRIRLRSVAEAAERSEIHFDNSPGEKDAAASIAALFDPASGIGLKVIPGSGSATKWYLSIFVCRRTT